ncbi:MAG: hypothetical protein NTW11_03470 [Candidatus Staskawiczbacteria bacterium]|nr:hypothetical protein [Candidatus Staskawiczbacteria bacterium]
MENQETKNLIDNSKNIYLITSQEPEAITSTLALFYTLKDLGKNVNLIIESLPENLKFLSPSLDFISYPKNFVVSIPTKVAQISQIHYEKKDEAFKIHLTLEGGSIKKDNISFYFQEAKPDLIITVGVEDYQKELSEKLNYFGFLLDSPVVDIDNKQNNKKFGKINLIGEGSMSEVIYNLIKPDKSPEGHLDGPVTIPAMRGLVGETAQCLLTGLVIYTENFKNKLSADVFQLASDLMKKGASLEEIVKNIYSK